jgi:uncharacterized damage-inducible protein DinB
MTLARHAVHQLELSSERFLRSTAILPESLSTFTPSPESMTAAQQIAHAAQVINWFLAGAFHPDAFDLDFAPQIARVLAFDSLTAARQSFTSAITAAVNTLAPLSDADLLTLLPPNPILGDQPRLAIIPAIIDHTAHHRGALTIYARLNHLTPADPYTS